MSQSDPAATAAAYSRWLRDTHAPAMSRRTSARNAAFFLPHLKPGMSVLDAGCGPGGITVGLSQAVGPTGTATGIDIDPNAVDLARKHATESGVTNATFRRGEIEELPCDDAEFDAVLVHAVLQHVAEPIEALREVHRVLRPGGVVGIGDADYGGSLIWPSAPALEQGVGLMGELRKANGASPYVGRQLGALLEEAAFRDVTISTRAVEFPPGAAKPAGAFQAAYFAAEPFVAHAEALGLASREELGAMSAAFARWAEQPGAFWATWWVQAMATA